MSKIKQKLKFLFQYKTFRNKHRARHTAMTSNAIHPHFVWSTSEHRKNGIDPLQACQLCMCTDGELRTWNMCVNNPYIEIVKWLGTKEPSGPLPNPVETRYSTCGQWSGTYEDFVATYGETQARIAWFFSIPEDCQVMVCSCPEGTIMTAKGMNDERPPRETLREFMNEAASGRFVELSNQ